MTSETVHPNPILVFLRKHKQTIKTVCSYIFVVLMSLYVCYTCYINGYNWGYEDAVKMNVRK